ncbi:MAG TPA: hypothetical protein VFX85_09410 [Solirubrobacterales bacterium]|nr:hypothetical protein [Solirubrobacterales bacterium]
MNDDWRLRIELEDEGHLAGLVKHLDAQELEDELSDSFGDLVILSREGRVIFAYTETRAQAEAVRARVAALDEEHSWAASTELCHWHPVAESWEEPDVPLPESDAARAAEHAEAIAAERARLAETGEPEYEVRVELDSHRDAARLAGRLQAEGLPVVRRWKYLVVGAADEDEARELAQRLELQAPDGSEVTAEVSGQVAWAERPANPFAIFGGLGG